MSDQAKRNYDVYNIVSSSIIYLAYLYCLLTKKVKVDKTYYALPVIALSYLTATYLKMPVEFIKTGWYVFNLISLVLLVDLCMKKNPVLFLKSMFILSGILLITNFTLMIFFPQGLLQRTDGRAIYLISEKNGMAIIIIPFLTISLFYSYYKHRRITCYSLFLIAVSAYSLIYAGSATAIVVIFIFIASIISKLNISLKTLSLAYVASWLYIVVYRGTLGLEWIVRLLGKSVTFTGRTIIWDAYILRIKDSLLWGFGGITDSRVSYIHDYNYVATHNTILQILNDAGMITLVFWVIFFVLSILRIDNNKDSNILKIGILCILIDMLMASHDMLTLSLLIVIGLNLDRLYMPGQPSYSVQARSEARQSRYIITGRRSEIGHQHRQA